MADNSKQVLAMAGVVIVVLLLVAGMFALSTSNNGDKDSSITIINPGDTYYTLDVNVGANGYADPSGETEHKKGSNVTIKFIPYSNYAVKEVTLDGISQGEVTSLTVTMNRTHTVDVTFKESYGDSSKIPEYVSGEPVDTAAPNKPADVLLNTTFVEPILVGIGSDGKVGVDVGSYEGATNLVVTNNNTPSGFKVNNGVTVGLTFEDTNGVKNVVSSSNPAIVTIQYISDSLITSQPKIMHISGATSELIPVKSWSCVATSNNDYIVTVTFEATSFSEFIVFTDKIEVTTESALIHALSAGCDIILGSNISTSEGFTITNKDITLDLATFTITSEKSGLTINNGSKVVIDATTGGISAGNGGNYYSIHASDSTVTINGGTYYVGADASNQGNSCIRADDTMFYINGGNFRTEAAYIGLYYVLNTTQTWGSEYGFEVTGGTFINYNPSHGDDALGGDFVKDGYYVETKIVEDRVEYTVKKGDLLTLFAWDGESSKEPTSKGSTYYITNGSELAWIASQVNANPSNEFSEKTFEILCDISLGNKFWTPIGDGATNQSPCFKGVFDGNGYTISDFVVNDEAKEVTETINGNSYTFNVKNVAGFFGYLAGTVKDLNISGAEIYTEHYGGVIAGYSLGTGLIINNCHVSDSKVTLTETKVSDGVFDNGDDLGGIIGYVNGNGAQITNCSVSDTTLKGHRQIGGIIGCLNSVSTNPTVTGNKVSNVTIIVDCTNAYGHKDYQKPGAPAHTQGDVVGHDVGKYFGAILSMTVSYNDNALTEVTPVDKTCTYIIPVATS